MCVPTYLARAMGSSSQAYSRRLMCAQTGLLFGRVLTLSTIVAHMHVYNDRHAEPSTDV